MISQRSVWAGLVVSAAFLTVFALLFLPIDDVKEVVREANFWYVAPSLIFYFIAVYFRSLRWRYLLKPLIGRPKRSLFPVVVVGYMANNILPVRLGEVVRSYYVGLRERVNPAAAFGTVAVERVFDVFVLFFVIAAVWVLPVGDLLEKVADDLPGGTPALLALSVLPFIGVTAIIAMIVVLDTSTTIRLVERLMFFVPTGIKARLLGLAERLLEGLTVVRTPRALGLVLLLSLPIWAAEVSMLYVIALGFDIESAFGGQVEMIAAIGLFMAIANLALVVPSTAGGVGPFNFFGAATLVALGVGEAEAGAYVLTAHIALLLPVTLLGLVVLLTDHVSLKTLLSKTKLADDDGLSVAEATTTSTDSAT
ncbi:MAG: flippase-like domain-containing protein [Chloroflexi bacterium]|nr:flippase-like domain-containing protein [Chloroflexota bacterium]MBT4074914.1 flippase-like domain-containing protein [Chloroflexota bacterium]MBT4515068.1 flippase-like domain-containing protein [Chloroflexota bacterium]MBT6681668.1 flippase-like domain-containing protein [Chloroflexota bacterium]